MAEQLTSREDATRIKAVLDEAIDYLEDAGIDRGAVGAAMVGFGLAVVSVHRGQSHAILAIDGARDAILAGAQ